MRVASTIAAGVLALTTTGLLAQDYPTRPIRWIVCFAPGGGADVLSRMLSPKISEALGQSIIVDNRVGAAGNLGTEIAAKSPPDGYTVVFAYSGTHSINPSLYRNIPFKASDFTSIIWLASVPQVIVVPSSLPITSVKELIAYAKARPGKIIYGSAGSGAINHLAGELFNLMTGTQLIHAPYKGGAPATIALLSGDISIIFSEPASIIPHIKSGKVRALAVTSGRRALLMPELPTVSEAGVPGYDVTSWNGMLAPAGTPRTIITRLNTEMNKAMNHSEMRNRMIANGYEPVGGEPQRLTDLIRSETEKWAKVVKAVDLKVD